MSGNEITKDWIQLAPGVKRQTAGVGEKMMQVVVYFAKGASTPEHSHVHEQITSVLSGKMKFVVAGEPKVVSSGEAIVFKSNVPHAAEAIEESFILDTFSPIREDLVNADSEHAKKKS